MSIAQATKIKEMDAQLTELSAKVSEMVMQREQEITMVRDLIAKVEALENRPRVGRPPKDAA